jgi:large subunit ribosomal protein L4e
MKGQILTLEGTKKAEIELPRCFHVPIREDLIKKAFEVEISAERQPYGAFYLAGKGAVITTRHRRRKWKTLYGYGISRVPRKIMTRRGTRFSWVGAFSPSTRGGRAAHPPKAEKIWAKEMPKKEKTKALEAAISATASIEALKKRYPNLNFEKMNLPLIIDEKITETKKAKELLAMLEKILGPLVELAFPERKIRAGKGKSRARKYKRRKGILIVTKKDFEAAKSLGIEVVNVNKLSVSQLAPSGVPGRLTVYTEDAIKELK